MKQMRIGSYSPGVPIPVIEESEQPKAPEPEVTEEMKKLRANAWKPAFVSSLTGTVAEVEQLLSCLPPGERERWWMHFGAGIIAKQKPLVESIAPGTIRGGTRG